MRSGRRSDALRRREVKPYHRPSCGRAKGIADGEAATMETGWAGEPSHAGARSEVVIAGGGFAGLSLAIALRQALGSAFAVAVVDPAFARPVADGGAAAIAAGGRRGVVGV